MKKYMLVGLGIFAFATMGTYSEAQAGVQVSINLGGSRPYYYQRQAPIYYSEPVYYYDYRPPVTYRRAPVYYSRPPVYYYSAPVYSNRRPPYACR
jgi:hypothetical protein